MNDTDDKKTVREAVAVFLDPQSLKSAIGVLLASGVSREQIGLLASEHSVRESLGDFYAHTNNTHDSTEGPVTAFVDKNSNSQQQQDSLGGSLFFVGTTGAMGAVVASSAVFGGALLAALSGVVAIGAVGAMAGKIIHQSDADYLQQQVDEGHILLFVTITEPQREQEIVDLLTRHEGQNVKVHEVNARGEKV